MANSSVPTEKRVDDKVAIPDDTRLWRLIDPVAVTSSESGGRQISSGQFRTQELSVRLATVEFRLSELKAQNRGALVAEFFARDARACDLIVVLDRKEFAGSHALIYRADEPGKTLSKSQARILARAAKLV